jgi:nitroimidazol reductase NimA-like FMN-containing flavoprotein (pyridoxamine 5'-phosphate oxidase superfamily)
MVAMSEAPSERSRVRRLPERGVYDAATINGVLDEALICHVAVADGDGAPHLIPTIHARIGNILYLHGSNASRTLRGLRDGAEITVAATIIGGLVLARSAFHSSMNYRSVVVFGTARVVTDRNELLTIASALADHVAPGRGADARPPTDDELRQTTFMAISLDEASAKVRTGPPHDDDDDLNLPIWAGVLPLHQVPGEPEPDPALPAHIQPPEYVTQYRRPGATA